jgi:hypothetical protein
VAPPRAVQAWVATMVFLQVARFRILWQSIGVRSGLHLGSIGVQSCDSTATSGHSEMATEPIKSAHVSGGCAGVTGVVTLHDPTHW